MDINIVEIQNTKVVMFPLDNLRSECIKEITKGLSEFILQQKEEILSWAKDNIKYDLSNIIERCLGEMLNEEAKKELYTIALNKMKSDPDIDELITNRMKKYIDEELPRWKDTWETREIRDALKDYFRSKEQTKKAVVAYLEEKLPQELIKHTKLTVDWQFK